jgi:hypothetical protein
MAGGEDPRRAAAARGSDVTEPSASAGGAVRAGVCSAAFAASLALVTSAGAEETALEDPAKIYGEREAKSDGDGNGDERPWGSVARRSAVALRLDVIHPTEGAALGFGLEGSIGIEDLVFIDVDVPFGFGFFPGLDPGAFFGNPSLGAHVAFGSEHVVGSAGLRVTAPVNDGEFSSIESFVTSSVLLFGQAGYDLHRYIPSFFPLGLPLAFELLFEPVAWRIEAAPILVIPIGSREVPTPEQVRAAGLEAEVVPLREAVLLQAATELAARADFGLLGGARFQALFVASEGQASAENRTQLAVEPFVGFDDRQIFSRLGVLVPLDEPLGFADGEGILAVRSTVGVRLP